MPFTPTHHPGTLHHYANRLVAFEHVQSPPTPKSIKKPQNFILFLGGLGDDLLTVSYPNRLANLLPASYSVAEVRLSSSGEGWTTSSLERDADEVAKAVSYFRQFSTQRSGDDKPARIVLLGHSTGSQIALSYLIGNRNRPPSDENPPERPDIDGLILQAGISDREGMGAELSQSQIASSLQLAKSMIDDKRGRDQLPFSATGGMFGESQPSARRWVSLIGEDGDDDLFSSDLADEVLQRVWGANGGLASRKCPALVLWGEKDEHVPKSIQKEAVLRKWGDIVRQSGGTCYEGVVPGAGHNLNRSSDAAVQDLCERIVTFIEKLESGDLAIEF